MAEQKELKKPGADQAGSIVAPCQKDIRLYPARLTLTDKAFEKSEQKERLPFCQKTYQQAVMIMICAVCVMAIFISWQ